jgi:hypothetical protein
LHLIKVKLLSLVRKAIKRSGKYKHFIGIVLFLLN